MSHLKQMTFGLIALGALSIGMAEPLGTTTFTITPSESNVNLPSNSAISIDYTLTNNATVSVPNISIVPGYNSAGKNFSMSNNTCGTTLNAQSSCAFTVNIPGASQTSSFTLAPKVCGFNGFTCSSSSQPVAVTLNTISLPVRAYEEVNSVLSTLPGSGSPVGYSYLVGINVHNLADIIQYGPPVGFTSPGNSIAVSSDGSTVYAVYGSTISADTPPIFNIGVFHVTANQLTLMRLIPVAEVNPANNTQMALTPDGSKLFLTDTTHIYSIDTASGVATMIEDPSFILINPQGIAISPDGSMVYVGMGDTGSSFILGFPTSATSVDLNNKIPVPAQDDVAHPGLAINSAGSKLYVSNTGLGTLSIFSLGTTPAWSRDIGTPEFQLLGISVSPDGNTVYASANGSDLVDAIHVNNGDIITSISVPNVYGVAISPDGEQLYATQTAGDMTTVINTANYATLMLYLGGNSLTVGNFMTP